MKALTTVVASVALGSTVLAQGSTTGRAPRFDRAKLTPLFDGKSLEGWTTSGGRYDGNAAWSVEDGAIVGGVGPERAGGLIYTKGRYESFLLSLETRIDYPFDSGVFLHMTPDAKGLQVTLDHRPGGEIGGIYSEGWLQHNPLGIEAFQRDAWNLVELRCTGKLPRVQVWLNGAQITDFARQNNDGFAVSGLVGLQVHGDRDDPRSHRARFRDIRLRELPWFDRRDFDADDEGRLTAKQGSRWEPLFNGVDLDGWEIVGGDRKGYVVQDGVLSLPKDGDDGYLRTKENFKDFRLRLDFKIARMANSGLFLRAARDDSNPTSSGCEIQILDDFNWESVTGTKLKPYQFTGGLYGSLAPSKRAMHELGRWNTYEVTYQGRRLRVELNGQVLHDVDTHEVPGKPFSERATEGFIGLQRHAPAQLEDDAYAWFRNIFVQRL